MMMIDMSCLMFWCFDDDENISIFFWPLYHRIFQLSHKLVNIVKWIFVLQNLFPFFPLFCSTPIYLVTFSLVLFFDAHLFLISKLADWLHHHHHHRCFDLFSIKFVLFNYFSIICFNSMIIHFNVMQHF